MMEVSVQNRILDVIHGRRLYCVNHLDALAYGIFAGQFDHVITDPPYSPRTHANMRGNRGTAGVVDRDCGFGPLTPELRLEFSKMCSSLVTGFCLIMTDMESIGAWQQDFLESGGLWCRAIPWVRWSAPCITKHAPPSASEGVCIFEPRKLPDDAECVAVARGKARKKRFWLNGGRMSYDAKCLRAKSRDRMGHPTEKPIPLFEQMLLDCTEPGEIVLDPFCGSGALGVACLKHGRRYIGSDASEKWSTIALGRLVMHEEAQNSNQ